MDYRVLGFSGLKMSVYSLGTWETFGMTISDDTALKIMEKAYESGINFYDCAENYGRGKGEEALGKALKHLKWERNTYMVSTKVAVGANYFSNPLKQNLSRKHITEACNEALKKFGLEYIDILFCHRPDPMTSLEDILISMNTLIAQGKIFYWGTSEFTPTELIKLHELAREYRLQGPVVEQTGYNMLGRWRMEYEMVPVCQSCRMGVTSFVPLKSGILTGKYNSSIPSDTRLSQFPHKLKDLTPDIIEKVKALSGVADDLGISMTHLALAWVLKNRYITSCILGATKPEQIEENVKALEHVEKLTDEVMDRIGIILDNNPDVIIRRLNR